MKKVVLLVAVLLCGATASPAFGQATRTWVSGVGDDANPCSRTAPCKTFAGAISKTAVDGIINAMDDGGFGTLTITKSMTVDGGGHLAGMLSSGGINAVNINIAAGNVNDPRRRVVLRNLDIEGNGTTLGLNGVNITGAGAETVVLENVNINDFTRAGVTLATGLSLPSPLSLTLDNVFVESTGNGLNLRPSASSQQVNALVRDSRFANIHSGEANSGIGVAADGGAHVWLTGNTIFGNDVGLRTLGTNGGTGVIDSFCDNHIVGNTDNGTAPNELCPKPVTLPGEQVTVNVPVPLTQCVVPNLRGLQVAFARKLLKAAHCALGNVTKKRTKKRKQQGMVLSQKTRAGSALAEGAKVNVTVGRR